MGVAHASPDRREGKRFPRSASRLNHSHCSLLNRAVGTIEPLLIVVIFLLENYASRLSEIMLRGIRKLSFPLVMAPCGGETMLHHLGTESCIIFICRLNAAILPIAVNLEIPLDFQLDEALVRLERNRVGH